MKKQVKILSIILILVVALTAFSSVVSATGDPIKGMIDTIGKGNTSANATGVQNLGATIVTIMQTIRCCSCCNCIINIRY